MFRFRFRLRFSYSSGDLKGVTYSICVVNNGTCVCMHRTLFVSYTQSVSYRTLSPFLVVHIRSHVSIVVVFTIKFVVFFIL